MSTEPLTPIRVQTQQRLGDHDCRSPSNISASHYLFDTPGRFLQLHTNDAADDLFYTTLQIRLSIFSNEDLYIFTSRPSYDREAGVEEFSLPSSICKRQVGFDEENDKYDLMDDNDESFEKPILDSALELCGNAIFDGDLKGLQFVDFACDQPSVLRTWTMGHHDIGGEIIEMGGVEIAVIASVEAPMSPGTICLPGNGDMHSSEAWSGDKFTKNRLNRKGLEPAKGNRVSKLKLGFERRERCNKIAMLLSEEEDVSHGRFVATLRGALAVRKKDVGPASATPPTCGLLARIMQPQLTATQPAKDDQTLYFFVFTRQYFESRVCQSASSIRYKVNGTPTTFETIGLWDEDEVELRLMNVVELEIFVGSDARVRIEWVQEAVRGEKNEREAGEAARATSERQGSNGSTPTPASSRGSASSGELDYGGSDGRMSSCGSLPDRI